MDQVLKDKYTQTRVRVFAEVSGVICRGYSLALQRVMTDFGADESFSEATKKISEHYGIDVSMSATQRITERHAEIIHAEEASRHNEVLVLNVNYHFRFATIMIAGSRTLN